MENRALLNQEQDLGTDQLLKTTALLYLKEALVSQEFEACRELIDAAIKLGASQGEISETIAGYLNPDFQSRRQGNRLVKGG